MFSYLLICKAQSNSVFCFIIIIIIIIIFYLLFVSHLMYVLSATKIIF
jgi:t-SNARE complex subunit (syntaxin)